MLLPAMCEVLRRSQSSVGLDARDEPAVISVNAIEEPEIVEAEIKQDEGVSLS